MPKIIIDNQEIECRDDISVLQAALDAGWNVPHYCYHPGLKVVASCRLCLMEMKMPHPKTHELDWAPKLIPSCQTPVRDGMEVRFDSPAVKKNQADCMEFFLLNHPLDCPVCDQAGECHLQDYSFEFGKPESRMVDQKWKNPKKDIGPKTLLYQDRCVLCTRCVRFTEEISGTHELSVVNRGAKNEIDVFPGFPLDNPLQGNVVDVCPVGCLLDKDFLFKQRVWFLKSARSVCAGCARGCSVTVDHNEGVVHRLKPRYNPKVNDWWMCDAGRYSYKYAENDKRVTSPVMRRGLSKSSPDWSELPGILRYRFESHVAEHGGAGVAAVLSPFMSSEEAWLLAKFIRDVAPDATLVAGPVPTKGEAGSFPAGASGDQVKFRISKEKCPNRRGVEAVIDVAGGNHMKFEAFTAKCGEGAFSAAWVVGGYPEEWIDKKAAKFAEKIELVVVQDIFENPLMDAAAFILPACVWVEREGSFINEDGLVQAFERAIDPPEGARQDGLYLFALAGYEGLYSGERVRELMAATMPAFAQAYEAPPKPVHAH